MMYSQFPALMAQVYPGRRVYERVRETNPLLWWMLNDASGTTAADASGNARTGTYNGSPTLGTFPGADGQRPAALLDGVNDYVERAAESYEYGAVDLLTNGGFETYTGTLDNNVNDTFTGWTSGSPGAGRLEATATAHGGSAAFKLKAVSGTVSLTQNITVEGGAKYALRGWSKGDGTYIPRYGIYDLTNAAYIRTATNFGAAGTTYAESAYVFTTPANCVSVRVELFSGGTTAADYQYFDDMSVKKIMPFSVMVWVYRTSPDLAITRMYSINRMKDSDKRMWSVQFWGTGQGDDSKIGLAHVSITKTGNTSTHDIFSTQVIEANRWYCLIFTYDPIADGTSRLKLYVNGVLQGSSTTAPCPIWDGTGVTPLRVGATNIPGSEHYFLGHVGHVAIWQRVLTAAEAALIGGA